MPSCCIGSAIAQLYCIPRCVLPQGQEGIPSSTEEMLRKDPVLQRRDKWAASCLPRVFLRERFPERGKMSDFKGKNPWEKLPGCFLAFFCTSALCSDAGGAVRRTRSSAPARRWSRLYINSQRDVARGLESDRSAWKLENAVGRGVPWAWCQSAPEPAPSLSLPMQPGAGCQGRTVWVKQGCSAAFPPGCWGGQAALSPLQKTTTTHGLQKETAICPRAFC